MKAEEFFPIWVERNLGGGSTDVMTVQPSGVLIQFAEDFLKENRKKSETAKLPDHTFHTTRWKRFTCWLIKGHTKRPFGSDALTWQCTNCGKWVEKHDWR